MTFNDIRPGDMLLWTSMCVMIVELQFVREGAAKIAEINCLVLFGYSYNSGQIQNYKFYRDSPLGCQVFRDGQQINSNAGNKIAVLG